MIGTGFASQEGHGRTRVGQVAVESLGSEAREALEVVSSGYIGEVAPEDGWEELGVKGCERVESKASGLEPTGKMVTSRSSSVVVISSYVTPIGGDERMSASVDTSSSGSRQIRQVSNREHSVVT